MTDPRDALEPLPDDVYAALIDALSLDAADADIAAAVAKLCDEHPELAVAIRRQAGLTDEQDADALGGRIVARDELGRGGMGIVRAATDVALQREVAIKRLRVGEGDATDDTPIDRALVERFVAEARLQARLDHPGVVPVHTLDVDADGVPFFSMRRIRGETFARVVDRLHAGESSWPLRRCIEILVRVAETIAFAHSRDVVHRDLKPSNVMVGPFGEVYVVDWGLARENEGDRSAPAPATAADPTSGSTDRTVAGTRIGTAAYMSPEQARGDVPAIGAHSDVYALGATLYHVLAGHAPYRALDDDASTLTIVDRVVAGAPPPLRATRARPRALIRICERAMQREPSARYRSAEAFADDLRAFLADRPVSAWPSVVNRGALWMRRNAILTAAVVALSALSAVALALLEQVQAYAFQEKALAAASSVTDPESLSVIRDYAARLGGSSVSNTILHDALQRSLTTYVSRRPGNLPWLGLLQNRNDFAFGYANPSGTVEIGSLDSPNTAVRVDSGEPVHATLFATGGDSIWVSGADRIRRLAVDGTWRDDEFRGRYLYASPDGERLVCCAFDPVEVTVRDREGQLIRVLEGVDGHVFNVAFAEDSSRFATTGTVKKAQLWSRDGEFETEITFPAVVQRAVFSPAGDRIALSSAAWEPPRFPWQKLRPYIGVFELAGDEVARVYPERDKAAGGNPNQATDLDRSGEWLLSGWFDGAVRVHDWDGAPVDRLVPGDSLRDVSSAVLAIDTHDDLACIGTVDGTIWLWNVPNGQLLRRLGGFGEWAQRVAMTRDGQFVVAGGYSGQVRVWRTDPAELGVVAVHEASIQMLARGPGPSRLVSYDDDGSAWWLSNEPTDDPSAIDTDGPVRAASWSPSGRKLATGDARGRVEIRTAADRVVSRWRVPSPISSLSWSPSEEHVVVAATSGHAYWCTAETGDVLRSIVAWSEERGKPPQPICSAFAPDGTLVVLGCQDGVRLWTADGEVEHVDERDGAVSGVRFDASGHHVLTFGHHGTKLWTVATREAIEFTGHGDDESSHRSPAIPTWVNDANVSADGTKIVSAGSDGTVRVWSRTGEPLAVFTDHVREVIHASFLPDGSILSASLDGTARLWAADGEPKAVWNAGSPIRSVVVASDGRRIITGSNDGRVRYWSNDLDELLELADRRLRTEAALGDAR